MGGMARFGHRLAELSPKRKLGLMLLIDGLFLPLAAFLAVVLGPSSAAGVPVWVYIAGGLVAAAMLWATGFYRTVVRFADLKGVGRSSATLAATAIAFLLLALPFASEPPAISAIVIFWLIGFAYLLVSRLLAAAVLQTGIARRGGGRRRNTLIYGAGSAGVQLAQAMYFSAQYRAVCFVDDSPRLARRVVTGLPVYGPDRIEEAIRRHDAEQIVVAIPSAPVSVRRALISRIETLGLPVKMLPGLVDLVDGNATVSDIRDIDVSDLLGRDPVPPDASLFSRNIQGKVVLVTGAGGSIGSELCRQILSQSPKRLVLLDHSEFALYSIEQELRAVAGTCELVPVLASVLDRDLIRSTLRAQGVQTVYHAAAYKHVPLVESNLRQGVLNNVFGTMSVAAAAAACNIEACVLISTDKAVRPTNIMGATKRIAELVIQAAAERNDCDTVFSMVRFGNVLGSSGSVVPLFKQQIRAGGPITITHPDVIRYFMLIPEAAQLVIQAGAMARGGEVFVLDMGEPVRIADLARTMLRLSGLTERTAQNPAGEIEIKVVGLRKGEKLYEELLIGDDVVSSSHPRIMCAMERHIDPPLLDKMLDALRQACEREDEAAALRLIRNLVPEYANADEVNAAALAGATLRRG